MNIGTLVVGGGATGSLIGFFLHHLQKLYPTKANLWEKLDIWEKDDSIGGRMKTVNSPRSNNIPIDIGAQYITTNDDKCRRFHLVYDTLLSHNVIEELNVTIKNLRATEGSINYVAPNGMSSIVQHFLNTGGFNLRLSYELKSLNLRNNKIEAETNNGIKGFYDTVILTMPVPDVLRLSGNFLDFVDQNIFENLKKIQFSSRIALVLIYENRILEPWAACYMPDDCLIKYIAIQEKKTKVLSHQSSVIIHSSTDLDTKFKTCNEDVIKFTLMDHLNKLFPTWGQPSDVICHTWNCSQVTTPFNQPSSKILILNEKPLIILAGDSFSTSNFDNCIESAKDVGELLSGTRIC